MTDHPGQSARCRHVFLIGIQRPVMSPLKLMWKKFGMLSLTAWPCFFFPMRNSLRLASLFFFRYPISFNNEYCEYPTYWYRLSTRSIKITKNEALDDCDASTWLEPAGDEGDECDEGEGEESQSWWSKNWSDWSNSSTSNPRNVTNQWSGWNETDETWTWKQDGWKAPRCFASAQGFRNVGFVWWQEHHKASKSRLPKGPDFGALEWPVVAICHKCLVWRHCQAFLTWGNELRAPWKIWLVQQCNASRITLFLALAKHL